MTYMRISMLSFFLIAACACGTSPSAPPESKTEALAASASGPSLSVILSTDAFTQAQAMAQATADSAKLVGNFSENVSLKYAGAVDGTWFDADSISAGDGTPEDQAEGDHIVGLQLKANGAYQAALKRGSTQSGVWGMVVKEQYSDDPFLNDYLVLTPTGSSTKLHIFVSFENLPSRQFALCQPTGTSVFKP